MQYKRNLSDLKNVKKNGFKVFSCFSCGGGSSMGYKNAGFELIGTCEIDPQMNKIYRHNHDPKYQFCIGVGEMAQRRGELVENDKQTLQDIYNVDILDGSPPCSTFSTSGLREKARGKEKHFREGQAKQVLDDLFFQYLDLAEKIQPKVIVAENVSGMLKGNAKGYVKEIAQRFDAMGYTCQIFLLNGASMGLPQKRERIFFIGHKKEYKLNKLVLEFNETCVPFMEFDDGIIDESLVKLPSKAYIPYWERCKPGCSIATVHENGHFFNQFKVSPDKVVNTLPSSGQFMHHTQCRLLTVQEMSCIGSWPMDYKFLDIQPQYLIGMSVPPLMMYKISEQIAKQWLANI